MTKIYLSGPMTGHRDYNFPAFVAEAHRIRALGHEVINPAEIEFPVDTQWHECMRADIAAMMTCEAIAMMPGWHKSAGAMLEMNLAHRVGMPILFVDEIRGSKLENIATVGPETRRRRCWRSCSGCRK